MDINTCFATTSSYHVIAYYAHIVPAILALFMSIFALVKTRFSALSIIFFAFCASFSLWLLGSLVTWVSSNYFQVYFWWSWLDYIAIVFFVLGSYFFNILVRGKVPVWEKILYLLLCIFPFGITLTGHSVLGFNQPVCEALNNLTLTNYKLYTEILIMLSIPWCVISSWKDSDRAGRIRMIVVGAAILLFFGVFTGGEHISDLTGVYEIILYGQFVLPVFLIVLLFSITNLGVFEFRLLGSQILAYSLIIMSGSQLLFIQDSAQTTLSLVTLAISIIFGVLLLQNAQKEEQVRLQVEKLARQLDVANKQQVTLIHFITHQLKGFVAKSRNIFSMIQEGDYGQVPDTMKPIVEEGFNSSTKGAQTISEILNAANIKSGKVAYANVPFDFKVLVNGIIAGLKPNADAKGVTLTISAPEESVMLMGDQMQMENAIKNLIDNSIKYTPSGTITITLTNEGKLIRLVTQDTGIGITPEDMQHLFTEGGHGAESQKVNVDSTGFGLYIVKNIIEAHNGKVWAESEGAGKGSRFIIELPVTL